MICTALGALDRRTVLAAGPALARVVVRRAKVVPDLVGQRQLGYFGRHRTIVVDKGDDARVQGSLGRVVDAVYVLGVPLVRFAIAAGSARG